MPTQRYTVMAVNRVTRRIVSPGHAFPQDIITVEVRAAPTPPPTMDAASGWSANTPTLEIGFTVWGGSVDRYVPGFAFDLAVP